MTADDCGIE
jgi:hypothetical protein